MKSIEAAAEHLLQPGWLLRNLQAGRLLHNGRTSRLSRVGLMMSDALWSDYL